MVVRTYEQVGRCGRLVVTRCVGTPSAPWTVTKPCSLKPRDLYHIIALVSLIICRYTPLGLKRWRHLRPMCCCDVTFQSDLQRTQGPPLAAFQGITLSGGRMCHISCC